MSDPPVALREVVPGVFEWSWFAQRFGYDFHGFLVGDPGGNIAIDPVEMSEPVLQELLERGVSSILLTNRNHYRDARRLHEQTGAPVRVHPADAERVREKGVPVAGELLPGDRVGPLEVFACPGKSPGEVVLHWPERRLLILGDAAVGQAPGRLGLLPEVVMDDPPRLRESLARVAADLDFDTVLCADGHHVLAGGRAALRALLTSLAAAH